MGDYSIDLTSEFIFENGNHFLTPEGTLSVDFNVLNRGSENVGLVNVSITSDDNIFINPADFAVNLGAFEANSQNL